jgi:hypothetical protein
MKRLVLGQVTTGLLLAAGIGRRAEQPLQKPQPSTDYARWRDQVLPSPREQSYRNIPWRTSVLRGVVDAQNSDKPVLILLMNGHPLGCT